MTTPFDRTQPPPPGPLRATRFPAFERRRWANGLELYLLPWSKLPLLSLDLLLPAGGTHGRPGLASLHGELLDEGTERRTALEIAATVERLGVYLGTGADRHVAYAGATCLVDHLDATLELVAEIVRQPSFPQEEVERVRKRRLAEILRRRSQPQSLAEIAFARAVYAGTPDAEPLMGTEASVAELERGDVVDFYGRHVGPMGGAVIAVGGDVDALERRLVDVLGDWPAQDVPPPVPGVPADPAATEVHLVDRPGSTQTQLHLGHLGLARRHPDHGRTLLMNSMLGGKFTSRINLILREKHGITYGASSQFVYRRESGHFQVRAAVATESAGLAVRVIVGEMRRIQDELVSPEELAETQDYLVGTFPSTLQTVGDLAKRLETLHVYGLPDDTYDDYPARLRQVDREDVRDAAHRYLHPDRLTIVAVGPAAELRPQLEAFGPVRVVAPD